jgi:uncharacterized protein (DUF1501 family)
MNRRKFLQNSAMASLPLFLQGLPVFAGNGLSNPLLGSLAKTTNSCNKILVVVQLNGGNDGLNMVINLDRYTELTNARSNILIPSANVLPLNGNSTIGLHPSMSGIQNLYNNGKIKIVQGVSYPNPNYSHFHAQDIWYTASNPAIDTGWLGRELDVTFPGYPAGYPNPTDQDPPAIQIGGSLPLSLQGANINMGYNVQNPATLLNVVNSTSAPAPVSDYGTELTFLRLMKDQSNAYTTRITTAYNAQATQSTQYATSGNSLSDQLKIVARLIGGGLTTPVYIVNHSDSFDTHVGQVSSTSTTTGSHADSLAKFSVAVAAFHNDLSLMNKSSNVCGMTFSEFGRRVKSNTSTGTDHGTAAPVIFFGDGVDPGILGTSPVLPAVATASTQVPTQFDFRELYASVMQQWLCLSPTASNTVLGGTFATQPIFTSTPLSLSSIDLSGMIAYNEAKLHFVVNDNQRYDKFIVQYSFDAIDYIDCGAIRQLNEQVTAGYDYIDQRRNANEVYYRILGITKQNAPKFSNTIKLVSGGKAQKLSVYPNPVRNYTLNIEFFQPVNTQVQVIIYGSLGEKLYYNQVNPNGGKIITFKTSDMFELQHPYLLKIIYGHDEVTEKILFE